MVKILENFSLKNLNSFCLDVKAKFFVEINSEKDLLEVLSNPKIKNLKKFVLGGGCNTLFTKDYDGLIIKSNLKGIKKIDEDEDFVYIESMAGEIWDDLVHFSVTHNFGGIENMVMIPSTVGAAPIQNIAAYGQFFSDVFVSMKAINLNSLELETLTKEDCKFEYRSSIFKNEYKNKYFIISIIFRFYKNPKLIMSYASRRESIQDELKMFATEPYSVKDVCEAVKRIRTKKLPSTDQYGTAGSFFKNPVISKIQFLDLQKIVPGVKFYAANDLKYDTVEDINLISDDGFVKLPAAWLLEELGWKGKWIGNCGTADNQALAVVTNKKASAEELINFVNIIREDFKKAYNIDLEVEVVII